MLVAVFVPVVAQSEDHPPAKPIDPPVPTGSVQLPGTEAIVQAHAEAVRREEQRAAQLETAPFRQQREASRNAYKDLGDEQAAALLNSVFTTFLEEKLNADPARYLSDVKLERPLGKGDAVVTSEGKTSLMEGSIPVRAENENGELEKVDLSLKMAADGFAPSNPLVEVTIGREAKDGVAVGDGGLTVTQVGANDSSGRLFGDKNVFFSEAGEGSDTDLLVSPIAAGVEMSNLLRSPDSPEVLRFKIDAPIDFQLREVVGGGAEVLSSEGEPLAMVGKPVAIDAQGTMVPVDTRIDGRSVVLQISHRQDDLAYPILVDPPIENLVQNWGLWWVGEHTTGIKAFSWNSSSNSAGWLWPNYEDSSFPGWQGLFIYTASGNLPAGGWGQWSYSAPNSGTYLANATVNPFFRNNHVNCPQSQYGQPYDYVGMWANNKWNQAGGLPLFNEAEKAGSATTESWGESLIIGMGTSTGIEIPCWRDVAIGGVGIWLEDLQYPYLPSVGSTPTGWQKKDKTPRTFSVSATDAGLGVRLVEMFGVGTQHWVWDKGVCAGTYEQRCPTSETGQISFTTDGFPYEGRYDGEGKERKFTVQAEDPTKKTWKLERSLWLDGTAPGVTLSGQLASITGQTGVAENPQNEATDDDELSLPTYKLQIAADDGADRSGVQEIRVYLDKDPSKEPGAVPAETKSAGSCPTAGCARTLNLDYTLRLPGLDAGKHSLYIVAVDKVGNASPLDRNVEFEYVPATGMKDEYVMQHFRLPDGNDYSGEAEYHGPGIAVNVINGNVVYHQRDVEVDADRAGVELERVYNSQQPTKQDTQWGRGWEISQAPAFEPEPEQTPAQTATMQRRGAITSGVPVPTTTGQQAFSARLRATVTKTAGGYEVESVEADEVSAFDSNGRIQEVVLGDDTPVYLEPRTDEELEAMASGPPTHAATFGSSGTGNGQFQHPSDSAVDSSGNVFVVDQNNNRIQKFSPSGEYLSKFGTLGSGNGQLDRPTAIAIDGSGNLWVADAGNNRIQKFSSAGTYLAKFGTYGTGNGQFKEAEGVAIDTKGNIWVADTYNGRIQKFNDKGEFVKVVGSKGSGSGQLGEPTSIDVGPGGKVWTTDWENNRVAVFSESGEFLQQFGSAGTGNGQFSRPNAIDVDNAGNVWVGDENNPRIQKFNQAGEYVTQFGTPGSGTGQFDFSFAMGIESANGSLWVADGDNNRVQRWDPTPGGEEEKVLAPYFDPPVLDYEYENGKLEAMQLEDEATDGADPELDLVLDANKVTEVESKEAGDTTYAYEGSRMTAVDGSAGETKYGYDGSERLTSIRLPNETTATITYDETSRATSVKVDPAGPEAAKTTNFSYQAEPRRTTVWGGGNPEITYDFADDGSVLKWAWAETPPAISSISGSLWAKKGQLLENKDQTLFVTGSSPHQVASIKVVVNGTSVMEEKTCEDPASPPSHVCDQPSPLEWITHPSEHAAGRMDIEVIVEDFLGRKTAERFFVVLPQQAPPDPAVAERPNFKAIKLFRDEYGLDRNNPLSEPQMNELILELLYEWEGHDPTAMRAVEDWGMPMRSPELAEMEWRKQFVAQAGEAIPQWASENAPSTYAGFYVDEREGSKIYVGFTQEQAALVEALRGSGALINPNAISPFPTVPTRSIASLQANEASVAQAIYTNPTIKAATSSVSVGNESNLVTVGATDVPLVSSFVAQQFGANAPISVISEPAGELLGYTRFPRGGPVYAGAGLYTGGACTAGFGAMDPGGNDQGGSQDLFFVLTAGHCALKGTKIERLAGRTTLSGVGKVGTVRRRNADPEFLGDFIGVDAGAIGVPEGLATHSVLNGSPLAPESIQGAMRPYIGRTVCWSGVYGGQHCGRVKEREPFAGVETAYMYVFRVGGPTAKGDSGGPVWDPVTHKAVGLITAGAGVSWPLPNGSRMFRGMRFTPLLPRPGEEHPEGALPKLGLDILREE